MFKKVVAVKNGKAMESTAILRLHNFYGNVYINLEGKHIASIEKVGVNGKVTHLLTIENDYFPLKNIIETLARDLLKNKNNSMRVSIKLKKIPVKYPFQGMEELEHYRYYPVELTEI